jgi:predicted lactoylglutathione lyase
VTLAHDVLSATDVDSVSAQAVDAGATSVGATAPTVWGGYSAYFQDSDGHVWEVAWNPQMLPPD